MLTPILVIIAGAVAWWLLTYIKAPQPFFIALYAVLAVVFIIWILGFSGYGPPYLWLDVD